jgi:glycerate kinase
VKVIVAPDSYKGSLDARAVAQAMEAGLRRVWPDAVIPLFPMADGGEGTLDALLASRANGSRAERRTATVTGADGVPRTAAFGVLNEPEGRVALLEAAQIVGLPLIDAHAVPVTARSSRGLGELMRQCLDEGIRHFMIGIGGTSSNDGGAGLLAALGVAFLDEAGQPLAPTPDGLMHLARVDFSALDARAHRADITVLSDVNNPLCGVQGATVVFGPQKGVTPAQVAVIDAALARFAAQADAWAGRALSTEPGAGAAGGLGYALRLLGGCTRAGAELVADMLGLPEALPGTDWVLTGEGRSDAQTLHGKVPQIIARYAKRFRLPITLVSGSIEPAALAELGPHFAGCFSILPQPMSLDAALAQASALIADRVEQLARLWQTLRPEAPL